MAEPARRFEPIEIPDDLPRQEADPAFARAANAAAASALALGLKTLSQRAIAATKDIFTLLSAASCFWLWNSTPDPNQMQIVSLSLYALFVLAANVIVRRIR
jgi:hypothetical protein